jgi:hypothetical protein
MVKAKIEIKAAHLQQLLDVITAYMAKHRKHPERIIKHYEYLPTKIKIEEIIKVIWHFRLIFDEESNIINLEYESKWDGYEGFFDIIAPLVTAKSYAEFRGEDGDRWRHTFDGNSQKQIKPKIIWDEP